MKYEQAIKKIDFLNKRIKKVKPWYGWSIKIDWNKIDKWCENFKFRS